jgi:Heterokaryon incompatibility protein (HET)
MGTIYAYVSEVLVWLGSHFKMSEPAFEFLDDIYNRLDNEEYIEQSITSQSNIQAWEAVSNLFRRDYWGRVWVIQEINLVASIKVHCGSSSMAWPKMAAVKDILRKRFGPLLHNASCTWRPLRNLHQSIQFKGPQSLLIDRQRDGNNVQVLELGDALLMHRLKHATDPRDKVYALVGLTTAQGDPEYIIDYTLSVRQVYVHTIDYIVRRSHRLDIICARTRGSERIDLPTWVPNFGSISCQCPAPFKRAWNDTYRASGTRKSNAQVLDGTLRAQGICIDFVQAINKGSEMEDSNDYRNMATKFHEWLTFLQLKFPSRTDLIEKYARLLFDKIHPGGSGGRTLLEFLQSCLASIASDIHSTFPDILETPLLRELRETATPEDKSTHWGALIPQIIFKRQLFITQEGKIGLAEESIQESDSLCVLFGCSVPAILRKGSVYAFVSDACVVDYMYGMAIEEFVEGIHQSKIFEIR